MDGGYWKSETCVGNGHPRDSSSSETARSCRDVGDRNRSIPISDPSWHLTAAGLGYYVKVTVDRRNEHTYDDVACTGSITSHLHSSLPDPTRLARPRYPLPEQEEDRTGYRCSADRSNGYILVAEAMIAVLKSSAAAGSTGNPTPTRSPERLLTGWAYGV